VGKRLLNLIQFFVVFVVTVLAWSNGLNTVINVFLAFLFLALVYEIPIKGGIKSGETYPRIVYEIIIVWLLPVFIGVVFVTHFSEYVK
jgi:hypothetical protein